jgi:hypothetical protein
VTAVSEDLKQLRLFVRAAVNEDLKNVGGKHEKTVAGAHVLKMMHDAPGVMDALARVGNPKELAHIIEAIIDAVPVVGRAEVLKALTTVTRHEKTTHTR